MSGKTAKASRRQIRRALDPAITKALDDHAMALRDCQRRLRDLEGIVHEMQQTHALIVSTDIT